MKMISSAEFRKTYPRLADTFVVTANGHAIGTWIPAQEPDADGRVTFSIATVGKSMAVTTGEAEEFEEARHAMTAQRERDAILRKINRQS